MNETPAFPMAPARFTGESREVDPGACFDWLRQGWAMFLVNPGVWIGSTLLLLIILMAISIVPLFGQIAAHLLVPLFGAGMVKLCRRIGEGEEPEIADLFAGFRHNAGQLVMVGVFFAAGIFGIAFIAFLLVSGGALGGVVTGKVAGFGIALGGVMLAGLLVMVLSVPVIMATWFAPALVFFHDMQPLDAMKASFAAGAKNLLPMMIFGVFLVVALFFAMLPVGMGLLLLLPVFSGAVYASYRDIFLGS
ncbi:MAG: hypothetical protein KA538_02765 [Azonexus sp.]|jgi:uncharacterized membrane protein|nr:hypothetical protein [Azonexus sp.]